MNNFIEENRFYLDNEYLTRTAYFTADENVNLEKLNEINFYKLLQYKEKLKDKKYLGLLFNFKNIKTSDFREFSKNELLKYVEKQLIDLIDLEMEVYEIVEIEYLSYVIYIFVICFSENKIFTYELSWD